LSGVEAADSDAGIRIGRLDTGQDRVDALPGEATNRLFAADLAQLTHRRRRQIVVAVAQLRATRRGQPVPLGRPSASRLLPRRCGNRLRLTHLDQGLQVASHPGGGQAQSLTDLPGGDRPGLQQQPHDGAAGLAVVGRGRGFGTSDGRREFHNTSVTQFR
jgi:hypothetical protein